MNGITDANDLIRRGDAIEAVYRRICQIGLEADPKVLSILQAICDIPTAADARPVVFCENCRNWDDGKRFGTCPFCWLSDIEMGGKNFCSLGIRRDEKWEQR